MEYSLASPTAPDLLWATLKLKFKDEETDLYPGINLTVAVSASPDATLSNLQANIRANALELLRQSINLLETNDLQQIQADAESAA
ncbi:hypothetical protein BSN85_24810 [Bradyrhizobium brasilense]|nr:hypothetical protein BSN85_24810 [Bradyrhizobium brasilense]